MASGDIRKVALITGINGQDGSYLAELLLNKGYEVHGMIRRASTFNTHRIDHLHADRYAHKGGKMHLHYGDMTDSSCLVKLISTIKPTEVYNLAAQSHVKVSFDLCEYTAEVDAVGTLRLLDAIRTCCLENSTKFYQASTSELYGKVAEIPQTEKTPFYPRSPYACAKLYGYWIVVNYREAYNMFACNGILFNHESPRRGETFVTRKITREVAKIHLGLSQFIVLGNLDSKRDWGHARDYVEFCQTMENKLIESKNDADMCEKLPKIDMLALCNLIQHISDDGINASPPSPSSIETHQNKQPKFKSECWVVNVRRDGLKCTVQYRVCPKLDVPEEEYNVSITINEDNHNITEVQCSDCKVGGDYCQHALALLQWLYRENEKQTSHKPTKKNTLTLTPEKSFVVEDLKEALPECCPKQPANVCESATSSASSTATSSSNSQQKVSLQIVEARSLSIHELLVQFKQQCVGKNSADDFLQFATKVMSSKTDLYDFIESFTRFERRELWYQLRDGRIRPSQVYAAAFCSDGFLAREIIETRDKRTDRKALIERQLLVDLEKTHNLSCRKGGIFLLPAFPALSVSSDFVGQDFIVEIACPIKAKNVRNYADKGKISEKYRAKLQLQMMATNKKKGYLCVVDPYFEETNKLTVVLEHYDETYTKNVIAKAMRFWKSSIFPRLVDKIRV